MQVAELMKLCKPMAEAPAVIAGLVDAESGLLECDGVALAPMVDFHIGRISALVAVHGAYKTKVVAGRNAQCGFLIGSASKGSKAFADFFGHSDTIFCTDLITAYALNKATGSQVVFCQDPASFRFSGASMAYVKRFDYDVLNAAYLYFGDVDYYYPLGQIEYDGLVKWQTARQVQHFLMDSEGAIS